MISFIPVTGTDSNGTPKNLLMTDEGLSATTDPRITQSTGQTFRTSQFTLVEVKSIHKGSAGTFATGYGLVNNATSHTLTWKKDGSTWKVYNIEKEALRPIGLGINDGKYLISYGTGTAYTTFSGTGETWPVSTLPQGNVDCVSTGTNTIDSLVSGPFVVGGSLSQIGSFTPNVAISSNSVWDHNAGEARQIKSGNKSTSYTFPGYSGTNAQVQRQDAHTNSTPTNFPVPTNWNTHVTAESGETSTNQGYYGVNNATLTATWAK